MADLGKDHKAEEELPDFDDDNATPGGEGDGKERTGDGTIRATGFKDFLLKDDVMKGIIDCGFEHPSEVQHACIPQAVLGTDVLCQAKAGMGKTAVFVIACLQTIDTSKAELKVIVLGHTRELAYQIQHEFKRLGKHMKDLKVEAAFGGTPLNADKKRFKDNVPHVLVGTTTRVLQLVSGGKDATLKVDNVTQFIVDECDRVIDTLDSRRDVQKIFIQTPKKKQVMMFSATCSDETRTTCKKFMSNPHEIMVESESKLTLHGLQQYYVKLEEKKKTKKLVDLLDTLEFNQVVIFVRTVKRALALNHLLNESMFPAMTLHDLPKEFRHKADKEGGGPAPGDTRIKRLQMFKDFKRRILVTTDLFGRGMDVERINIVINYDFPVVADMYMHRVGRCGRFGTKGLTISMVSSEQDEETFKQVQSRFEAHMEELPDKIDSTSYLNA